MVNTLHRCLIALFISSLCSLSLAAEITVSVDRDHIRLDESFQLTFAIDGDNDTDPDFSELRQNFHILSRQRLSGMSIINGRMSRENKWQLTVMAKQAGQMLVSPVRFGNEFSKPLTITIHSASTADPKADKADMFIEVSLEPESAYVQSQVIYSVRFFRAVQINGARMHEPEIDGAEALIEKLGDDNTYETRVDGRRYIVVERKYALFPQQSGRISIGPVSLDAQVVVASRGMFDPFGQNTRTQRLQSDTIELEVKAAPSSMQGKNWLPATALTLNESWSGNEFIVGEPVTRTLTLKAEGVTAAQLPPMHRESRNFKSYPDQPRLNNKYGSSGTSATRQEKIALIPTIAGEFILPAIEVSWWNTATDQLQTNRIAERRIHVKPAPQAAATPAPVTVLAPQQQVAPAKNEDTEPADQTPSRSAPADQISGIWPWVSAALGLGWALTLLAWWLSRSKVRPEDSGKATPASSVTLRNIKKACLDNDAAQASQTLLNWANGIWQHDAPSNLAVLGLRLAPADHPLQHEIDSLQQTLYGAAPNEWRGQKLWQTLEPLAKTALKTQHGHQAGKNNSVDEKNLLLPLYP